jgi:hypothetical protein
MKSKIAFNPFISYFLLIFCFISNNSFSNDDIISKKVKLINVYSQSGNKWELMSVTSYFYNKISGEDSIIYATIRADTLLNSTLTIKKYNQRDSLIEKTEAEWYAYNSNWYYTYKTIYTYDSMKKLIREDRYYWKKEDVSDNWKYGSFYLFFYNTNSRLNSIIFFQFNQATKDTIPKNKWEYFFDENNNLRCSLVYNWDNNHKGWKQTSNNWRNYIYDNNNRIVMRTLFHIIDNKDTIFEDRESFQYNDNNDISEEIYEIYVDSISSFVNSSRRRHYYSDNMIDSTIIYIWKNNEWELKTKMEYIYIVTDVEENKRLKLEQIISISPNPAEEYIEIYGLNKGLQPLVPEQEIKIYNLLGECVMSVSGAGGTHPFVPSREGNIRIDVSGLPAGVYIVRLGDWVGRFLKI